MKNIVLLLITTLLFVSCKGGDDTFNLSQDQLVGKEYKIPYSTIRFVSADSLDWRIERLADKPSVTSYRLKYELDGSRIQLASKDTIRVDYTDQLGNYGYVTTYYNDSFDGSFVNNNTLRGEISSAYDSYKSNMFWISGGSSSSDVDFKL